MGQTDVPDRDICRQAGRRRQLRHALPQLRWFVRPRGVHRRGSLAMRDIAAGLLYGTLFGPVVGLWVGLMLA